jgi:limonene-1,2-epoxide hydrolase
MGGSKGGIAMRASTLGWLRNPWIARIIAATSSCLLSAAVMSAPAPAPKEGPDMPSGIALIEDFVDAFNHKDVDRIMTFFTDDAVYHNLPMEPVRGAAAVRKAIEAYVPTSTSIDWEILHISQAGETVLTERVDRFVIGGKSIALPVMGAFDLDQGKIKAWRDYFDLATWTRQMSGQ